MRYAAVIALLLAGCRCGEDSARPQDASTDARRDAEVDAPGDTATDASDAGLDATDGVDGSGSCPVGEELVEPFRIPHDAPTECGDGCRQVTWAGGAMTYDVFDTRLAYSSFDNFVGVVDLETGEEIGIPVRNNEMVPRTDDGVAIRGSSVVYSTFATDDSKPWRQWLWRYDLVTHCRKRLRDFESLEPTYVDVPFHVDVHGTWIVWADERWGEGKQDLFSFDLNSETETRLTYDECCVAESRLWSTDVVYQGWADGPRGIHLVDVTGGEPRRLWDDPREQRQPAIQGRNVVFTYQVTWRPDDSDLHGVDLDTGEDFVVVEESSLQRDPDIYGEFVVWGDWRNDANYPNSYTQAEEIDIYGRDLTTGEELQVTSLPGAEGNPRIWNRTVYFVMASDAGPVEIFAIDLPE